MSEGWTARDARRWTAVQVEGSHRGGHAWRQGSRRTNRSTLEPMLARLQPIAFEEYADEPRCLDPEACCEPGDGLWWGAAEGSHGSQCTHTHSPLCSHCASIRGMIPLTGDTGACTVLCGTYTQVGAASQAAKVPGACLRARSQAQPPL